MRFGLLGTGYWATETLAPGLAAHGESELVAVWGRDPAKAAKLAARYGARAYADVDELLADVDAVAVGLPPDIQAELALRAADAGRHLLLDKPLSLTLEAAQRIAETVEARRLASVVFFTNRFVPAIDAFLREGSAAGGWYAAHGTMYTSIFQPGNPYGISPWRREHGGLWDIGPHALAMVVPLLGPVVEVSAARGPRATSHLLLRHAGGAASTLSLTLDAAPEATAFQFSYFGEHGATTLPASDASSVEAYTTAIGALVAQAGGAPAHPCDIHFGRDVVAVLAAAERSARERRFVTV